MVSDAKAVGANALLVQTVRRFDCFCNQATYPRTGAAIAAEPYDPLAEIVAQGHRAGLEVHAWVNVTTLWNSAEAPANQEHVYNTHGLNASGANRWLNKRFDGAERIGNNTFVDPANPAVVEYIVEGIRSLQRNYDLDGINLDYIRYPDYNLTNGGTHANDWGYSEVSLARFHAATGRSDVSEPTDEQFIQWRRDQVTALVRRIYLEMLATDARDRLSVNAVTYGHGPSDEVTWKQTRPYTNVLQDWSGWAKEGIVDTVTAMNYKREWLPEQELMFDSWNRYLAEVQSDTRRLMVSGSALYLNDLEHSVQQAKEVVGYGLGWSGYSYASVSRTAVDDSAQRNEQREALAAALTAEVFTKPARVPKMSWKRGKQAALLGTVAAPEGSLDQASVELRHQWTGRTYTAITDGSGWFGMVGLPRGHYQVSVNGVFAGEIRIRRGQVTTVELTVTA